MKPVRTLVLLLVGFVSTAWAQVSSDRLLNASREPQNWLTYSGDYTGRRFSSLHQISAGNVEPIEQLPRLCSGDRLDREAQNQQQPQRRGE